MQSLPDSSSRRPRSFREPTPPVPPLGTSRVSCVCTYVRGFGRVSKHPNNKALVCYATTGFEGPAVICRHDGTRLTVNDLSRMLEFCEKLSRKCVSLEDLEGENPHMLWAECRGWRITGGPRLSSSEAVTQEIFHTEPAKEVRRMR